MNVLVLGGNGYLGSKVVWRLVELGATVVCTKRVRSDLSRLNNIMNNIIWIPASVDAVETAVRYLKFDYVINMACNYGRESTSYDSILDANIEFPLKVLNKTVEEGTTNFLTVDTGLPGKLNMYSFSKKIFSEFGRFYVEKHKINFYSLQLEMFYGADEPQNRFLPSIIRNMIMGNDINITIGTQHRDIISIEDTIDAIMLVIKSGLYGYNEIPVGTGQASTISEIIDYIWNETGKKSKINKGAIPMRKNEPDCIADVSILKSIGNWNPIPWKCGIQKMIAEIKNREFENK